MRTMKKLMITATVMSSLLVSSAFADNSSSFGEIKFYNNASYPAVSVKTNAGLFDVTSNGVASVYNNGSIFEVMIPSTHEDLMCMAFSDSTYIQSNQLMIEIDNAKGGLNIGQQLANSDSNHGETMFTKVGLGAVLSPGTCTGDMPS